MNILLTTDNYYPNVNGSSYFTQRLAYYLKQRGHSVLVIAPGRNVRHHAFEHDGVPIFGVHSVPYPFYQGFRFTLPIGIKKALANEVKRFQPDVVHIQDHFVISSAVQKIASRLFIPVMGTNHFMPENLLHYLHLPKQLEEAAKRLAWKQFRTVFEKLAIVTTPTATAAGLLKDIHFPKPVLAISNGIDLQKFNPTNNGAYLRQRWGLPDKPLLLYVGRLDKEKNLDLVLKSLPEVLRHTEAHLVIAGKGAQQTALKRLAHSLGLDRAVHFVGFVPDEDLPNLYPLADCFVIAGIAELQSIVTMEAMASALPVVAVNAMALPELVRENENGFLFDPGDSARLAEALVKIFSDSPLRQRLSRRSVELIQQHDINKTMDTYESLYRGLIQQPHE